MPSLGVEITGAVRIADDGTILVFADRATAILTPVDPPDGDIDLDCRVGIADFLAMLAAWGPCPAPCPPSCTADLDGDCTVGIVDFLLLLANWG